MEPIEVVTLEDGGQRAEDVATRLVAWLEAARESLDLALYDVRLPGPVGDDVAGAIRATAACGSASCSTRTSARRSRGPSSRRPAHGADPARAARCAAEADPGVARPDASQVRRARRRGGLDRLGQLDARQLDAGGERARDGGLARAGRVLHARLRADVGARARRRARRLRRADLPGRRGEHAPVVLPRPRARALAPHRQADRRRPAARADRLAAPHRRPDPRHPQRGAGRAPARRRRGLRRHDTTFVGSFNLSRSGETNAENVLEISDPALAERMATWIDGLRTRFPPIAP